MDAPREHTVRHVVVSWGQGLCRRWWCRDAVHFLGAMFQCRERVRQIAWLLCCLLEARMLVYSNALEVT